MWMGRALLAGVFFGFLPVGWLILLCGFGLVYALETGS
jgi:hypothetical protein